MSGWNSILEELEHTETPTDIVRRKYIEELSQYTGRNVITYYSGWLSKQDHGINADITDSDMTGFMNAVNGLDCSKGLDLILHTPGGFPEAAEAIVNYLRSKFNSDIRVIVPQLAMSAGTMMACSASVIIMGKHSSLGPIDPQFNGIPAYNIKCEFEDAKDDLAENPNNAPYWAIKLQQYPAAFMKTAIDAIDLASDLATQWLGTCMYDKDKKEDEAIIKNIVSNLNEHENSKIHGRHLNIDFCKSIGLKIQALEDDEDLQDRVLSLHHAYMLTLDSSPAIKIIENQNRKACILNIPQRPTI